MAVCELGYVFPSPSTNPSLAMTVRAGRFLKPSFAPHDFPHKAFCLGRPNSAKPRPNAISLTRLQAPISRSSKTTNTYECTCCPRVRCSEGIGQACLEVDERHKAKRMRLAKKTLGVI